jgi:voltage-gated potassium channel
VLKTGGSMAAATNEKLEFQDLKDPGYEIFIIFVSVLSVFNLVITWIPTIHIFLSWIPDIDPDAIGVILVINFFLTIIFLLDFLYRLFTASSKRHYFISDAGWIDLLASIPAMRIFRLFRIYKAYRLLKKYGAHNIGVQLMKHRADSMFYIVIFCVIIVIEGGAFWVLMAERVAPDPNILTASDALWWCCVTITTVGYGDHYPVTTAGRLVGVAIMAMGVGLIGTLAGFIANKLLAPGTPDETETDSTGSSSSGAVADIYKAIKDQNRLNTDLAARLERIENQLKER